MKMNRQRKYLKISASKTKVRKYKMKTDKNIVAKVEDTYEVLDKINEVKISASFKQNVIHKIEETKKVKTSFTWFTPQLQLAAMVVILLVNVSAIIYTFSTEEQTSAIDVFAQAYNFDSEDTFTLNFNN